MKDYKPEYYYWRKRTCTEVQRYILNAYIFKDRLAYNDLGNIIKYLYRAPLKNHAEDIKKAQTYLHAYLSYGKADWTYNLLYDYTQYVKNVFDAGDLYDNYVTKCLASFCYGHFAKAEQILEELYKFMGGNFNAN